MASSETSLDYQLWEASGRENDGDWMPDGNDPRVLSEVRRLIDAGANVRWAHPRWQSTCLHRAARKGNLPYVDVVKHLVENGADVTKKDNKGDTARMDAERRGRTKVVKILEARYSKQALAKEKNQGHRDTNDARPGARFGGRLLFAATSCMPKGTRQQLAADLANAVRSAATS